MNEANPRPKLLFVVTEDWYFCSHRLALAKAARGAGFEVTVATRVRAHGHLIEQAGIALVPLEWRRSSRNPLRELKALLALIRTFHRERPALVHHVALKPVFYGSIAALVCAVPHTVNAIAGLGFAYSSDRGLARALRGVVRRALRWALSRPQSMVLVQNEDDAGEVARMGIGRERIRIVPGSGVDGSRFRPLPEPQRSDGVVVVSLVGRMLWDKGVADLVEAAAYLRRWKVPVEVRLYGDPDPDNPASIPVRQLESWGEEGAVKWLGFCDDVPRVWSESHIAVLPSFREGYPRALLEAAACARPLIATDVPGCRALVDTGRNGVLVPPGDPRTLAEAIRRLAVDPALRRRLGSEARATVEGGLTEAHVNGQILSIYRELAGPGGRRAD